MILITGSLAYDQIMDFPGKFADSISPDKLHILNVSFLVNDLRKGFGGTAGNIAYNLSLLGVKTSVMGLVGEDFAPYRAFLEKNEIGTAYIREISHYFTSSAYGITDKLDNQIWGFYTGADSLSEQLSIGQVREKINFGIIAPHNPKAMSKIAKEYQMKRIPYLFDPGMQLPWFNGNDLKDAFNGAKIIIGNDYEVGKMQEKTGIKDLHELSRQDKVIITTLGEKGSEISAKGEKVKIAPAKIKSALDPAGAGDAYRSGFMAGFMRGFPVKVCGQMGSVASAYTVEKYGTTTHKYTLSQFSRRYRENYQETLPI